MGCPCGGERLAVPLPAACRDALPGSPPGATLCATCLRVEFLDDAPDSNPDFQSVSDAFPRDGEDGARLAAMLWMLDSLAHYRSELSELAATLERSGVDPLLFLDRLSREPGVEPHFDLKRREAQFEQLLYDV